MREIKEDIFVEESVAERFHLTDWRQAYEEEQRVFEEERKKYLEYLAWEYETLQWLNDPKNQNNPEYSDIYKEVWGVRPRPWNF